MNTGKQLGAVAILLFYGIGIVLAVVWEALT